MKQGKRILIQAEEIQRTITRMAHEILERNGGVEELTLIGIRSRGAHLVRRIARKIETVSGVMPAVGIIDITPYRDDAARREAPSDSASEKMAISVEEKTVVLVDDVIYTGRTIRAALDLLSRLGRPKRTLVAILVDRGERELPIKADIVGKNVQVDDSERVNVLLQEADGTDQVTVTNSKSPASRSRPAD